MNISELSIRRPVLSTVLTLIILLFGFIGYSYLGVREYPSVDNPIISVSCSYPGANADVIENQITEPLEQNINGIPGISKKSGRLNIINLTFLSKVMIRFITVPFRPGTITYSMNKNDINGAIQSTPVISCIFLFFPAGQNLSNCFHAIWSKRKSLVISAKFKT